MGQRDEEEEKMDRRQLEALRDILGELERFHVTVLQLAESKPSSCCATKQDLDQAEERITMKVSEIKGDLNQVKATLLKVLSEVRQKIDLLDAKIAELTAAAGDGDLPEDVVTAINDLKALSAQLDDVVPDAIELPPPPPPTDGGAAPA